MLNRKTWWIAILAVACVAFGGAALHSQTGKDAELLRARESVWRLWFAGDTKALAGLVPPGTIVMSGGEKEWKNQQEVLRASADFHAQGGRLTKLEFPRTEVQHFGEVAIIWSDYALETEMGGKRSSETGRVTEIFVKKDGRWTNPGWHTDQLK